MIFGLDYTVMAAVQIARYLLRKEYCNLTSLTDRLLVYCGAIDVDDTVLLGEWERRRGGDKYICTCFSGKLFANLPSVDWAVVSSGIYFPCHFLNYLWLRDSMKGYLILLWLFYRL
jgi:hypothetical protein